MSLANDVACMKVQEEVLRFSKFDEADAWALGNIMRDLAERRNLPMVLDIRIGTRPLFYFAMPGTTPENPDWVRRKVTEWQEQLRSDRVLMETGRKPKITRAEWKSAEGARVIRVFAEFVKQFTTPGTIKTLDLELRTIQRDQFGSMIQFTTKYESLMLTL